MAQESRSITDADLDNFQKQIIQNLGKLRDGVDQNKELIVTTPSNRICKPSEIDSIIRLIDGCISLFKEPRPLEDLLLIDSMEHATVFGYIWNDIVGSERLNSAQRIEGLAEELSIYDSSVKIKDIYCALAELIDPHSVQPLRVKASTPDLTVSQGATKRIAEHLPALLGGKLILRAIDFRAKQSAAQRLDRRVQEVISSTIAV